MSFQWKWSMCCEIKINFNWFRLNISEGHWKTEDNMRGKFGQRFNRFQSFISIVSCKLKFIMHSLWIFQCAQNRYNRSPLQMDIHFIRVSHTHSYAHTSHVNVFTPMCEFTTFIRTWVRLCLWIFRMGFPTHNYIIAIIFILCRKQHRMQTTLISRSLIGERRIFATRKNLFGL